MKNFITLWSVAIALLIFSCKPSIDTPTPAAGSTDFSQFIAVGNSLTAGFADGGLYLEGQQVAFPNLMAEQMKSVGGGTFTSPFFDAEHANGSGYLKLTAIESGSPVLENVTDKLAYRDQQGHLIKYTDPIQNLGVPGMRLDLAFYPPFGALNNYLERLLPDNEVGTRSYFDFATQIDHTFFSFWLGNNDALGYATGGGYVTQNNAATTQLTDKATFTQLYTNFIAALTAEGQQGVVATIPDVTAIPFFNTVTIDALLQGAKAAAGEQADQIEHIYIQDETAVVVGLPPGVRPATAEDLVVLTFMSAGLFGIPNGLGIPYGLHPLNPIEDKYILDKSEVARVKDYVQSYNNTIKTVAESEGLAIADVYAYLNEVKGGVLVNGVTVSATFITGGAISLDGIHLTPKGNALIANLFIEAINRQYGANISAVDPNQYTGVKFP